ncbi:hypothetical protein M8997_003770 [Phyllobacterium sp. 21LDTY02-6]|uniref:hypothetical protein n=1 Tax=unclassified Phyllobacterium TaxID=2638441 RepID=UPI0020211579|nr:MULTISPECIES: hypothetical protein [unclassified Phyllobacterium]MCO4316293.1 hypothetical protein [Phyllobacterium sp. 21LDTY02-6]MCX8282429.1 hypothetical protein [Phyllobacterium sp. 0TCS1.6C]MCX8292521.1 hypothetical protein [Phyllobacterium sp. 0TCS1.6A]
MAGRKTHEQQLRIIEKREETGKADKDFDAKADLRKSDAARDISEHGNAGPRVRIPDDQSRLRGEHQESRHNKPSR